MLKYKDGEVVADKDTPKRFFIVIKGAVAVEGVGKLGGSEYKAATFRAGGYFGEYAMMENKWSFGTATASGDVVTLSLDREQFVRVFGDDLRPLIKRSLDKKKLVSMLLDVMDQRVSNFYNLFFALHAL